jgi:uncharacterized protein YciI
MYVVLLTYTAPLEEVDYVLPDHAKWLDKHFQSGEFLASGRRNPSTGGVILVRPMPRGKLDAVLASDPFAIRHLAAYEVLEFAATRTAPELRLINEAIAHTGKPGVEVRGPGHSGSTGILAATAYGRRRLRSPFCL